MSKKRLVAILGVIAVVVASLIALLGGSPSHAGTMISTPPTFGATVTQNHFPGTDRVQAAGEWDTWTGTPGAMSVQKMYLSPGSEPSGPTPDMRELAAAGAKMVISIKPPYPATQAGYRWVKSYLSTLKTDGVKADIILWQEPIHKFPTAADYINYVRFYAPAVRMFYPLVYNPNVNPQTISDVAAWYPGSAYIDKIEVDSYGSAFDKGIRAGQVQAVDPSKPFGWIEWGVGKDAQTTAQFQTYANYIVSVFKARQAHGLPNADVIYYNGDGPGNSTDVLTGPSDPKIPVIRGVYDALTGTGGCG